MINSAHCWEVFFLFSFSASFLKTTLSWFERQVSAKEHTCKANPIAVEVEDVFLSLISWKIENELGLNISSLHFGFEMSGSVMEGWSRVLLCHFPAVQWSSAWTSRSPTAFTSVRRSGSAFEFGFLRSVIEDSNS